MTTNTTSPAALEGRKHTPRTDATLEAMQGGRYSADNCHPLYVLSAELEEASLDDMRAGAELSKRIDELKASHTLLLAQNAEMKEQLAKAGVGPYKGDYYLGRVTETGAMRYQISNLQERVHQAEAELATIKASNEEMASALASFAGISVEHWPAGKEYFDVSMKRSLVLQARAALSRNGGKV